MTDPESSDSVEGCDFRLATDGLLDDGLNREYPCWSMPGSVVAVSSYLWRDVFEVVTSRRCVGDKDVRIDRLTDPWVLLVLGLTDSPPDAEELGRDRPRRLSLKPAARLPILISSLKPFISIKSRGRIFLSTSANLSINLWNMGLLMAREEKRAAS